jgi:hypothetical protein
MDMHTCIHIMAPYATCAMQARTHAYIHAYICMHELIHMHAYIHFHACIVMMIFSTCMPTHANMHT